MKIEYETELRKNITGKNEDWEYHLIQTEIREKGKAYLFINRCEPEEFDRLLIRVTHQAVRNGARQVYVCDKEEKERLIPGKAYGYYTFRHGHDMLELKKEVPPLDPGQGDREWEEVKPWQVPDLCALYNKIFFAVPNSATVTENEFRQWMANSRWHMYFVKSQGKTAGFLILVEKGDEVEIDSLGILEEFRGRGLAKKMLRSVEAAAAEKGIKTLSLGVSSVNTAAYSLYRSMGFGSETVTSRWYVTEGKSGEGER